MKTVHQVSALTGVSVRTLHHYDAIGIFKPTEITQAGYRLYDDKALERLQSIMLFRELKFPLKEIGKILDRQDFDLKTALSQQIDMLELEKKRLDRLIGLAKNIKKEGEINMDFSAFDKSEIEEYAKEAKKKWGETDAFREYSDREKTKSTADKKAGIDGLMALFEKFGAIRTVKPESQEAQELVGVLSQFITDNFYTCTKEILSGLGQMYMMDDRMRKNIDKKGGEGTALFASEAIKIYCGK